MNRSTVFLLLVIGGWAVLPARLADAAEPPISFLVRWQVVTEASGSFEILIFRDGLVVSKTLVGGQATYHRVAANPGAPGALERLQRELRNNHVGFQPFVICRPENTFSGDVPLTATLTWFGKGRQSRFAVSTMGTPPPCGAEPENLVLAVEAFLDDVSFLDVVRTVP